MTTKSSTALESCFIFGSVSLLYSSGSHVLHLFSIQFSFPMTVTIFFMCVGVVVFAISILSQNFFKNLVLVMIDFSLWNLKIIAYFITSFLIFCI